MQNSQAQKGDPVTLPVHGEQCGGPVTIQLNDWRPEQQMPDNHRQAWFCRYCTRRNAGSFPGVVMWASKRLPDVETVQ